MPINPAIALGVQSPQFESPMNMMAQMMQVKGAQEASQLNALKLQQAQREVEQQNMLGQAYQSAFDPEKGTINYNKLMSQLAGGGAGAQIPGILKGRREAENADVEAQTKKVKLLTDTLATVPEMYKRAATPDDLLAVHNYVHSNPVLGPWLQSIGATPEKGLATLQAAAQTPEGLAQYRQQAMSSISQILDAAKPLVVAPSASVFAGGKFAQAPAAPEKTTEPAEIAAMRALGLPLTPAGYQQYRDAQRPERMLSPAEEAQRMRIAAASRSPAQPVAPTITTIVDPTDPTKMIAIDAKRYQGGGAGSPGVIGVSGKEPGAALRENKAEAGKTQLADDLDNLRASFQKLDAMRAIPSTERNVLSNIMSATGASGVGQTLGRATGTEAQVERDVINSARQRLVTSIKNATGMSAQQLNSNVELQTMLKSISDPGQSVQAAMRIIDDIEQAYVKGNGKLPKGNAPAIPPAVVPSKAGGPAVVPTKTKSGATASNW